MKRKRIIVIGAVIVIAVAAFLIYRLGNRGEEGVMLLSGNVEVTETNVGFKIPGRVIELRVDEGYRVKEGDILARLDNAELAGVVSQNRAALKEAAVRLSEFQAGSRFQEIGQAKANVSSQEAEPIKAKKDYERAEMLYKNGDICFPVRYGKKRLRQPGRASQKCTGNIEPCQRGTEKGRDKDG